MYGVGGVHQQAAVEVGLVDVRVEGVASVADVIDSRRQVRGDERRHLAKIGSEPAADAVVNRRAVGRPGVAHQRAAFDRVFGG